VANIRTTNCIILLQEREMTLMIVEGVDGWEKDTYIAMM
jgi:hypothetical protein